MEKLEAEARAEQEAAHVVGMAALRIVRVNHGGIVEHYAMALAEYVECWCACVLQDPRLEVVCGEAEARRLLETQAAASKELAESVRRQQILDLIALGTMAEDEKAAMFHTGAAFVERICSELRVALEYMAQRAAAFAAEHQRVVDTEGEWRHGVLGAEVEVRGQLHLQYLHHRAALEERLRNHQQRVEAVIAECEERHRELIAMEVEAWLALWDQRGADVGRIFDAALHRERVALGHDEGDARRRCTVEEGAEWEALSTAWGAVVHAMMRQCAEAHSSRISTLEEEEAERRVYVEGDEQRARTPILDSAHLHKLKALERQWARHLRETTARLLEDPRHRCDELLDVPYTKPGKPTRVEAATSSLTADLGMQQLAANLETAAALASYRIAMGDASTAIDAVWSPERDIALCHAIAQLILPTLQERDAKLRELEAAQDKCSQAQTKVQKARSEFLAVKHTVSERRVRLLEEEKKAKAAKATEEEQKRNHEREYIAQQQRLAEAQKKFRALEEDLAAKRQAVHAQLSRPTVAKKR